MKKVRILMPAYNSGKTIEKTLRSLQAQTHTNFEVLVMDNCSTDDTQKIIEDLKDDRFRFVPHEVNAGNYGNFDRCLQGAGLDYSAIFHSDDIYEPRILEEQVAVLESRAEVGAVFTEAKRIGMDDTPLGSIKVPFLLRIRWIFTGVAYFDFAALSRGFFRYNCFLVCPTFLFRPQIAVREIVRTFPETFDTAADVDVWLRIARNWKVAVILKPLIRYRISNFQHSHQINARRIRRSDFIWIMNFYTRTFRELFRPSRLDIRRTKLIDLVVRYRAMTPADRHYGKLKNIIASESINPGLFIVARWWKYFLLYWLQRGQQWLPRTK